MKAEKQRAILMMLEHAITVTGDRNMHRIRAHIEEVDGNYVLRVQSRLVSRNGIFIRDITPKQITDWSLNNMGNFFRGFLDWFLDEQKLAEKEKAE